jgi:ribulose-phosphate 3-epimerase
MIAIAPSILAADFSRLGEQVLEVAKAGADRIHVDVMDGHFVPNLSMGSVVVKGLRSVTKLPLEVHLMVTHPAKYVDGFIAAGADSIIFHLEVEPNPQDVIADLRSRGKKVGLAFNPDMPVDRISPFLADIDIVILMSVFPGFGGQAFIPESYERIRQLRAKIQSLNPKCELEVDGGVDTSTVQACVKAGANVLVAGTAIFGHKQGAATATLELRQLAAGAEDMPATP